MPKFLWTPENDQKLVDTVRAQPIGLKAWEIDANVAEVMGITAAAASTRRIQLQARVPTSFSFRKWQQK